MASIRIDNLTDDILTVCLDGKEYRLAVDEKLTIGNAEKGQHELTVRSFRESTDSSAPTNDSKDTFSSKLAKEEASQYVRLSGFFKAEINSSKSVIAIKKSSRLAEKTGVDALFSGFDAEITGGKMIDLVQKFSDSKIRHAFLIKHLIGAFFPIGIGILLFTIIGLFALAANLAGSPVTLGGTKFTYPWTFGLLAIDLGFIVYFTVMIINIFKIDKKYK